MARHLDLHHEFYAIFLSIWASFLIRSNPFVMRYALWVLFTAALLLYAMHRGFHTSEPELFARLLDFHIPTMSVGALGGVSMFGFGIRLLPRGNQPPFEQCVFLVFIVMFWIGSVELTRIRAELGRRREARLWRR